MEPKLEHVSCWGMSLFSSFFFWNTGASPMLCCQFKLECYQCELEMDAEMNENDYGFWTIHADMWTIHVAVFFCLLVFWNKVSYPITTHAMYKLHVYNSFFCKHRKHDVATWNRRYIHVYTNGTFTKQSITGNMEKTSKLWHKVRDTLYVSNPGHI